MFIILQNLNTVSWRTCDRSNFAKFKYGSHILKRSSKDPKGITNGTYMMMMMATMVMMMATNVMMMMMMVIIMIMMIMMMTSLSPVSAHVVWGKTMKLYVLDS